MSDDTIRCNDCGYINPAGSTSCWRCNYPLVPATGAAPSVAPSGAPPITPASVRPIRPRRPRPQQPLQLQLWLVFGALAVLLVLYTAFQGFHKTNFQPVTGAKPEQQKLADEMQKRLGRDSLDVEARITLADLLYDTGNWQEAITHYTVAARLDPMRASTFVDMGVCWFNMGDRDKAEELFRTALEKQPNLAQALFNLGIVHEQKQDWAGAMGFYQRAIEANPPQQMQDALQQALQRVNARSAGSAPPGGK